ncbi:MAG: sulfatase-like hydrolase/transferase [Deltaproteobacteria bacterium]|nr:sulfatase-like hydrolase/transferase [Deltaproteobacteria bacterium]
MNTPETEISTAQRSLRCMTAALLCALQFFVLIPSAIFVGNADEFNFSLGELLPHALPWIFASIVGASLLGWVLPRKISHASTVVLICLGVGLYVQSALLLWDYGQLDGTDIAWDAHFKHGLIDAAAWLAVFACGLHFRSFLYSNALRISAFVILIEIFALFPALRFSSEVAQNSETDARYEDLFRFSPTQNAIVILLDSLQSPVFAELLKRDPTLAEEFRDFTFLPNTTSSFPSTLPSIPSILSGVAYDSSTSLFEYFTETVAKQSLPAVLRKQGFQVSLATLPGFCRFFQAGECAEARRYPNANDQDSARQEYIELLDYSLFRSVPHHLKRPVYNDDRWVLRELLRDGTGQRSRVDGSIQLVNRFEAEAKMDARKPTFKFIHLILPHPPLRVDAQCAPLTKGSRLTNEGYLQQARCALRQAARLLQKFEAIGIYDVSTIVVTADHGLRLDYGTNQPAYAKKHGLLQVSRALPLLLVKAAGHRGDLAKSQRPAQLIDIAKTLGDTMAVQHNLPGENLFRLEEDAERERLFTDLSLRWAFWRETKKSEAGTSAPRFVARGNAWDPHNWSKVE